jgi:hypothetical protein
MIAYQKLPGSLDGQGLNGVLDFNSYWDAFKHRIKDLYDIGPKITTYWARISYAQQKLVARGDTRGAAALDDELKKIADDMQKWSRVKGYLDTWVPTFMNIEKQQNAEKGLGIIPALILGVTGIFALSYIVNTGMALLQDYEYKSQLTQAVIDQKLSTGQMTDILSVPRSEGVVEKVISTVGVVAGVGIPTVLLIGGGLYLLFATGMLRSILGSRS